MKKGIDLYLYACGNGAHNINCEKGTAVLQKAIEKIDGEKRCQWHAPLQTHNHHQQIAALADIVKLSTQLAQLTQKSAQNNRFFITLGGDHTTAIGDWSGAANASLGEIGLIWFDAHMDSHTFETTPSNNIHGMPLAILLGHGDSALTQILSKTPKLQPENVVLIGVRSYEAGEKALLKKLGVKIFYMNDIKKLGIKKVIAESLKIVTTNTTGFGISIDLDGFDPIDAPGVGSPVPDGIRADNFLTEFSAIAQHPKLIGADIAEFDPTLDVDHKTEKLAVALVSKLIGQGAVSHY